MFGCENRKPSGKSPWNGCRADQPARTALRFSHYSETADQKAAVSDIRAPRRIQGPAGLSDQGAGVAGLPGAHFGEGISHGRRSRGNELGILRTDSDPGGGSGFDQPVSKDGADRL